MPFGTPVDGGAAYGTGTSVTPAYPAGIAAGDQLVLIVGQKPSTANGGTVTTPTGWTLRVSRLAAGGYGTTLAADTGNTNLRIYTKNTVSGTETGTLSVTVGTNNVCWALIIRIPKGSGISSVQYTTYNGTRDTAPTGPAPVTIYDTFNYVSGPSEIALDAVAIVARCIPTDVTTPGQFTNLSLLAPAGIDIAGFGIGTELEEPDSSGGSDIGGFVGYGVCVFGGQLPFFETEQTVAGTLTNVRGPLAALIISPTPPADSAEYSINAITFGETRLIYGRRLSADPGSYSISGKDATLTKTSAAKILVADAGSYSVGGQVAELFRARRLTADAGAYTLSGQNAETARNARLFADAGSYSLSGQPAETTRNARLPADAGAYSLSGQDATLELGTTAKVLVANAGSYSLSGQTAELVKVSARVLTADAGTYSASPWADPDYVDPGYSAGTDAQLIRGVKLPASAGAYAILGRDSNLFTGIYVPPPTRRPRTNARFEPYRPEVGVTLAQLQQEDELATELLLTLVTKGFFDGTFKS